MKVPNVIYLQTCGDCDGLDCDKCDFGTLGEVTWCKDKINDSDTAYFSEGAVRNILQKYQMSDSIVEEIITGKSFAEQMKGGDK